MLSLESYRYAFARLSYGRLDTISNIHDVATLDDRLTLSYRVVRLKVLLVNYRPAVLQRDACIASLNQTFDCMLTVYYNVVLFIVRFNLSCCILFLDVIYTYTDWQMYSSDMSKVGRHAGLSLLTRSVFFVFE